MLPQRQTPVKAYAISIAGGPVANLLAGIPFVILVVVALLFAPQSDAKETARITPVYFFAVYLVQFLFISLVVGLINLVPTRSSVFPSDGRRLLTLIRGGAASQRMTALAALGCASTDGIRPRDLDPQTVELSNLPQDGSQDEAAGCYWAYLWSLDSGRLEDAQRHLQQGREVSERFVLQRVMFETELLYYRARYLGSLDEISDEASQHKLLADEPMYCRALSARSLLSGNAAEAISQAERGLRLLEGATIVESGMGVAQRDWFKDLIASANQGSVKGSG